MSFEVYVRKSKRIRILQIMCILVSVAILAVFASLIRKSGSLLLLAIDNVVNNVPLFVAGLFTVSLVLPATIAVSIFSFYREMRPRIKVKWRQGKRNISSRSVL